MVAKGYTISHQKVSINVNLNGTLNGYTELTIIPTGADLKVVWLNAHSLKVLSASLRVPTVVPLAFSHLPPPTPALTEPGNIHTYPELKRAIWRASNEGEEGELGIAIPQGCIVKVAPPDGGRTPATATAKEEPRREDEWEPIAVMIEYEVIKPGAGIVSVQPDEANPSRFPHVFTSSTSDLAARTWVPCSDYIRDRCTWDLEFVVPRLLYSSAPSLHGETLDTDGEEDLDDYDDEEWPVTVVASGELVEQVIHPDRSDRVIWHYVQAMPVSVQQIAWAVGPFVVTEILGTSSNRGKPLMGPDGDEQDEDNIDPEDSAVKDQGPKLHALCLPGRQAELAHSVGVVRQAMDFYTSSFGQYPYSTYTVAFIDSLPSGSPTFHSAAMTLLSSDLLHPPSIIDQAYETRHTLAHALAVQWSGINLIPRTPSDNWLIVGIALHLASLFLKTLWGTNEYRFRLKKDMLRCVAQDVQREPMSVPARHSQPEPEQMQFIALKAPLVLHILDKHLRKSGTSLGLDKVLPKLFLDAITGDLGSSATSTQYNTLSTTLFMRICKKACGGSSDALGTFFDQWVYGSGCPTFVITAVFNRKKMAVELNVTQECRAFNWSDAKTTPWEEKGHLRALPQFVGLMTIRIHEADGTPYEHVLNIQDTFKRHEVPFNTKYKRIRRNTKRYQARQAAATAAASGDAEAQEDMGLVDVGFGLTLWEDEAERDRWKVADWTEEDDLVMSQATYEWIRIDAELEWICGVEFKQPDFMWISQLQRDRDVVAQLEAIHALQEMPSPIVASNLTKAILVTNYFFRIRMEACLALVKCATPAQNHLGLFHLLKLFQTRYCFEPETETKDPFAFRCIPKTNDFRDLREYFLKKSLVTAISMLRDEHGQTPPVVQQFLVDLLAYNDNLGNPFSDTFYLTTVMNGLAHSFVTVASRETGQFTKDLDTEAASNKYLGPALEEVERYMSADRLVPSYHNAITVAGLEWKLKLTLASLLPQDRRFFLMYTRDGNYPAVRLAAFDALLLFNPFSDATANSTVVRYIFAVMREDSSLLVQRRLAQATLYSIPVLVAVQDLAAPEMVFEEEGTTKKEAGGLNDILKSLRKKPGRSQNYRNSLLSILTHPEIDPEVRWTILKLCESTAKTGDEPLPKMRFRLPSMIGESPGPASLPSPQANRVTLNAMPSTSSLPKITIPRPLSMPSPLPPIDESLAFNPVDPSPPPPPKVRKVKAKAPPKLEQSQAAGMQAFDVASCKKTMLKLLKDKNSVYFRLPVDPVKSGAPGYFDIIKNPMDLNTMNAKLQAGQYLDRHAFHADFKLMVENARVYNRGGPVVEAANKLEVVFDKQWERVEATLRGMTVQAPERRASPPSEVSPSLPSAHEVSTSTLSNVPARTVSFKLKVPSDDVDNAVQPPPLPPFPPPQPTRAPSFKITLGGPSMDRPLAPPPPAPVAKPSKPPKAPKMAKSASFQDDVEFAMPALPLKVKGEGALKGKKKPKDKEKVNYDEDAIAPDIDEAPAPPSREGSRDEPPPMPPAPSNWFDSQRAIDVAKAQSVLAKIVPLPTSFFFREPVDPEALPTYYIEIKEPMDLRTMGEKLSAGRYKTYGELFDDFDLIVRNCKQFNPPHTQPVEFVDATDRAWRTEWEKASKLPYATKRSLLAFFKKLMEDGASFPFRESIETIPDIVPAYEIVIPRHLWRDLRTIRKSIEDNRYADLEAVDADIQQMLENCFTFNAPGTPVYGSGEALAKLWKTGLSKVRSESKGTKRPGDGKSSAVAKKQKF